MRPAAAIPSAAALAAVVLAVTCASADASPTKTKTHHGQPANPGAQPIGSAPAVRQPVVKKPRPKTPAKADTPLRVDRVVLGDNVGPGIAQDPAIRPRQASMPPIIHAPPNWRGTETEWEDHVRNCYAEVGATDGFTGEYIASADLLARCPLDRGAEGPILTARGPHGEHIRPR